MTDNIQTGFRIDEDMSQAIEKIASACGMSKNAAMRMLMEMGIMVFEKGPQLVLDHVLSHNAQ